ncbi:MAG: BamA/TamA family outer membrane protein [Deltaproteobacteria bacterium]|nr:BamA/TamA family outer membrane protein [Deltaproteobacteria bacterium]
MATNPWGAALEGPHRACSLALAILISADAFAVGTSSVAPDSPPPGAILLEDAAEDAFAPSIIESVEVVGNEHTAREVVLSRLYVATGDLLEEPRLEQSRLRLLGTGFFESVELSLRRGSRKGRVVLLVEVVERNTITIDGLYLGASSVTPFFAGLGIHESNFLGQGVSAGAAFVAGRDRFAIDAHLFVPELLGAISLSASGLLVEGQETLDPTDPEELLLSYSRAGGRIGLGVRAGPAQQIAVSYRLESVVADRLPNIDPKPLRSAPSIQFDESILSTLSVAYERDTRDDPFVARQGSRFLLAVETGTRLLGSSYEFSRYTASAEIAFAVWREHSLRFRGFGGLVQGNTPFFNQFLLSDYAFFAFGRDALPRALGLNFSAFNDYDDLIGSVGVEYAIPVVSGDGWPYRGYFYLGADLSATASLEETQDDPTGRGFGARFPLSFDLGLRFDTTIGYFTISTSYLLDVVF